MATLILNPITIYTQYLLFRQQFHRLLCQIYLKSYCKHTCTALILINNHLLYSEYSFHALELHSIQRLICLYHSCLSRHSLTLRDIHTVLTLVPYHCNSCYLLLVKLTSNMIFNFLQLQSLSEFSISMSFCCWPQQRDVLVESSWEALQVWLNCCVSIHIFLQSTPNVAYT